jgi:hypothetical protein
MKASNYLRGESSGKVPDDSLARFWRQQPTLARWSYAVGVIGALLSVHDFHHPKDNFGFSTPVLGVAILLYLLSLRRVSGVKRDR